MPFQDWSSAGWKVYIPAILAAQESQAEGSQMRGQLGPLSENLSQKLKRDRDIAQ